MFCEMSLTVNIGATMKRPKGVAAIVVYYIGSATVLVPLVLLLSRNDMDLFSRFVLLFTSPVLIVLSVGLWKMKNWARASAAFLTAVGLLAGVVSKVLYGFLYDFGIWGLALDLAQDLVVLVLNLWILTYLLSSRIRGAFLSASGRA